MRRMNPDIQIRIIQNMNAKSKCLVGLLVLHIIRVFVLFTIRYLYC